MHGCLISPTTVNTTVLPSLMVHFPIRSLKRDYQTKLLALLTIAADNIVKVEDIVDVWSEGLVVPTVELPHSIPAVIAV